MSKKILFVPLVLCVLLLSKMPEECVADASAQLEQAEMYQEQGQYAQAEEICQQIVADYPCTDHAFKAQKNLTMLYVTWNKQPQAEAAFQQLLTSFSGHRSIIQAVHDIAYQHRLSRKNEKANQLDQHVIDNWFLVVTNGLTIISSHNRVRVRTKRTYRENPNVYKVKTQLVFCRFVR